MWVANMATGQSSLLVSGENETEISCSREALIPLDYSIPFGAAGDRSASVAKTL